MSDCNLFLLTRLCGEGGEALSRCFGKEQIRDLCCILVKLNQLNTIGPGGIDNKMF